MLKRHAFQGMLLAVPLLTCGCTHQHKSADAPQVKGDSPRDVASSIVRMKAGLDPDKQIVFGHAVTTLTLVAPDKSDPNAVGYMTPHFARMVKGRNADEIIALADLYRASIPSGRR